MSDKLCLKWNDFQENVKTAFVSLREDKDFSDVTLACEDGQQFEAHKVILAASSPFFQNLLKRNKHSHPIIYMRGMKSDDLNTIINFLYCGEANVYQENLDSFLAIAEELKLKGLMGQNNGGNEKEENVYTTQPMPVNPASYVKEEQTGAKSTECGERPFNTSNSNERKIVNPDYPLVRALGGLQELDQQVKSMMKQSQNRTQDGTRWAFICQVCGKEGHNSAIRNHIEANHLEGVSLPCSLCERVFRSRHNLKRHNCENRTQASPIYSGLGMP